ncbi:MAG TPA: class E sortase [Solirubrobacteraceae bacterium]|jgi:sortase A|nr:class E sortase [Solirubrobacteraceae bacterium]
MRRPLRALSTVLIIAGALMLSDAGLTVAWQEPVSALYAQLVQGRLSDDLRRLEHARPTGADLAALRSLEGQRTRMAFLARALRRSAKRGAAVGRIRIDRIGVSTVVVDGTDATSLRKGPGIYDDAPFPGAPGTVAIAGHRTTYLAPFRHVDRLRRGDDIVLEMPYGRFRYRVERTRIVAPSEVSVVKRVSYDRLVLSACHPLYSAAKRIIVFARFDSAEPRGAAVSG